MGCGSSTSARVAPIIPMARTGDEGHRKLAFASKEEVNEVRHAEMTDEERSRTSTPQTQLDHDRAQGSPNRESAHCDRDPATADVLVTDSPEEKKHGLYPKVDGGELPTIIEPLPPPSDVDSMALPVRNDTVPHWEREEAAIPATPTFSSKRPGSSSGRIVVYKTEKSKKMEEEAKKRRNKSKEAGGDIKSKRLPPLKEWKKKCMNQEEAGSQWLSQSEMSRSRV
mmetsp:Transcript_12445/g.43304  ORF Transcript_12445/g.43304 Transcript_12445/m.43304 type:complete len:225 (-) Transcript_12445:1907-2581(-)